MRKANSYGLIEASEMSRMKVTANTPSTDMDVRRDDG